MTEIASAPSSGTAPTDVSPVYAFNTDSARGLALAIDLLDKGVNVYRASAAVHGRRQALLHGRGAGRRRVAGRPAANLAALADKRDTPVTGLQRATRSSASS